MTCSDGPDKVKGVAAAVVRLSGACTLCLGSFHLDGKVADERERTGLLPAAVLRSGQSALLDVALLSGDVNFTMAPELAAVGGSEGAAPELPKMLVQDLARAAALTEKDVVVRLGSETRGALMEELASPAGRARLQRLDGCPEAIPVQMPALKYDANFQSALIAAGEIANLQLEPMPSGSFLTYRVCNLCDGLGDFVADGVRCLSPASEVSSDSIRGLYFSSKDGKAGAIKKRGHVTRLQLGWLDRLYVGCASTAWKPDIVQGDPLLLQAADGDAVLDHLMVPWLVTFTTPAKLA